MASESSPHQTQDKFIIYFVSLAFTLLGLSVQTAEFGSNTFTDAAELFGWLSLLLCGLVFLSYFEWVPVIRADVSNKSAAEVDLLETEARKVGGQTYVYVVSQEREQPIDERILNLRNGIAALTEKIKREEKRSDKKYAFSRWAFTVGVIAIMIARGFVPFYDLLVAIW